MSNQSVNKYKIYLSIAAISFVQGLQISVSPIVGSVAEHFSDVDVSLVQMIVTIPAFVAMIFSIISGWLVVKVSKKKMLLVASALAGAVGLLPLAADNFWLLFGSRAVYGISLGVCTALNTAVVSEFFVGDERVKAMGVQAACVGSGYLILSALSGFVGKAKFTNAYFISLIGFVCMAVLAVCLPDTGKAVQKKGDKIKLNGKVFVSSVFIFFEMLFLITFSTNISMHQAGKLAGDSSVSGILTAAFSGAQIVAGLILGAVTRITKKFVLPCAMFSFVIGGVLLVLFPSSFAMLFIASLFVGLSQGIYIPSGYVDVSNAVAPVAVAMASACFTAASNIGQTVSPFILNKASQLITGSVNTTGVYLMASIGMAVTAVIHTIDKAREK